MVANRVANYATRTLTAPTVPPWVGSVSNSGFYFLSIGIQTMSKKFNPINLDYHSILKLNRALADSAGLKVEFYPDGHPNPVPCTDGKRIILPKLPVDASDAEAEDWLDCNFHEIGHNLPINRGSVQWLNDNEIDTNTLYGAFLNIAEDNRIDENRCEIYPGMTGIKNSTYPRIITNNNYSGLIDALKDKSAKAMATLMAFDWLERQRDMPGLRGLEHKLTDHFDEEAIGWLDKLSEHFMDEYADCETFEDTLNFIHKVMKEVFGLDPEEEKRKAQESFQKQKPKEGKGKGEKEEGAGAGGSDDNDEDSDDGEKKPRSKEAFADYEKYLTHDHKTDEGGHYLTTPTHMSYDSYKVRREYDPHTPDTTLIEEFFSGKYRRRDYTRAEDVGEVERLVRLLNIPTMVSETRRLLQVMTRKRPHFNQRKGRLDTNKIYRVCEPYSSRTERIFKTKQESKALDTAVSILIDYSGSMGGYKMRAAMASAYALAELCKMLRLNFEIAGFSETSAKMNRHFVFKPFNIPVGNQSMLENMCFATSQMSNNADGDSILVAWERLQAQKQARKVLVVLSDGSPAGYRGGDLYGFTRDVIQAIEAEHRGDIIGIGIKDRNVTHLYKHHYVVSDIEQLPKALVSTLEHCILE